MKELLAYLLNNIVDHPEAVTIDEETDATGTIIYKVKVHAEDVGKVIGKQGKIINSIRNLVRIKAIKLQQRARVEVVNPPMARPTPPASQAGGQAVAPRPGDDGPLDQMGEATQPMANQAQAESQTEPAEVPVEASQAESQTEPAEVPVEAKTVEELTQPRPENDGPLNQVTD